MCDYISREDAKNALLNKGQHTTRYRLGETWELNFMEIIEALDAIPAANLHFKKCGKWEMFYQDGKPKLKCSNCHSLFDIRTNDKHICIYPKFCEECGVDMRKKEDKNA